MHRAPPGRRRDPPRPSSGSWQAACAPGPGGIQSAVVRLRINPEFRRVGRMPKGGSREGAGRPRGSRGWRTKEAVAKAEALGPTPLEVLLESMHAARAEGARLEAVDCAKAAAPYVHPKLAPTSPPAPVHEEIDYTVLSDTELGQLEKIYSKLLTPA